MVLFLIIIAFSEYDFIFPFIASNYTSKDLNKIINNNHYAFDPHVMQNVWTCLQAK